MGVPFRLDSRPPFPQFASAQGIAMIRRFGRLLNPLRALFGLATAVTLATLAAAQTSALQSAAELPSAPEPKRQALFAPKSLVIGQQAGDQIGDQIKPASSGEQPGAQDAAQDDPIVTMAPHA